MMPFHFERWVFLICKPGRPVRQFELVPRTKRWGGFFRGQLSAIIFWEQNWTLVLSSFLPRPDFVLKNSQKNIELLDSTKLRFENEGGLAPAAYRIFWYYGPGKKVITMVAVTPHP